LPLLKFQPSYLKFSSYITGGQYIYTTQTDQLMMYSEIIAVCSEIHTEDIYKLCGQNADARGSQNAASQSILRVYSALSLIIPGISKCISLQAVSLKKHLPSLDGDVQRVCKCTTVHYILNSKSCNLS